MISPNEHPYVDVACAHAVHDDCSGACPYCASRCVCGCHRPQPAPVPAASTTPPRAARESRPVPR